MPKILIVEDNAAAAQLFAAMLSHAGFETDTAKNGSEAMQLVATGDYDLVLTDLVMPDSEGLGLIYEVIKTYPQLPVIAISGRHDYLGMAKLLGACEAITKPVRELTLLRTVAKVLGIV